MRYSGLIKKPQEYEAVQYDGTNAAEILYFLTEKEPYMGAYEDDHGDLLVDMRLGAVTSVVRIPLGRFVVKPSGRLFECEVVTQNEFFARYAYPASGS